MGAPRDGLIDLQAPLEPTKELGQAVKKVYLCFSLAKTCTSYLGFGMCLGVVDCCQINVVCKPWDSIPHVNVGWQWLACLFRLILFSILLSPGIFLTLLFYCLSPRIHRNIWYSREVMPVSCT